MMRRRAAIRAVLASAAACTISVSVPARAGQLFAQVDLRGAIDAQSGGLRAGTDVDQGALLNRLLAEAAPEGKPVFLPPGVYRVSNITLPAGARLMGVPGASRLVYTGEGSFLNAENAETVSLKGIVVDGANRWLDTWATGSLVARNVMRLDLDECEFIGSQRHAVALEGCGGGIRRTRISGAAGVGIYAVQSTGLTVTDNHVFDCANGGILVHRWEDGADNSIVTGNRIERIGAADGGTGQNGNGINVFRAANVMIANNHVSDCAFSAIRSNSGSNVQIVGNQCLRSGETALYTEFSFEGAVIASNLIDGGANGISVANFNEGGRLATVANNIVRNIVAPDPYEPIGPGFGWGIAIEADTAVTGNSIENVSKWGILMGWGPFLRNVSVTGNIVRAVPVGVAVTVVEEAQQALISGNVIEGTPEGAVVGFRWGEPATADLTSGEETPAHLTVERNRVV
ncbi:TIGR03808 family TAT-translocated repetitive protein [Georhizobium profundi]|uniref:TIGR03808 family TAT-translocated repetitive protein n=1 Tax=Georhizobium profundi TaxID=2341112 RepID=A0A3Q8XRT7_9HYPH|nr:TIGR03808 family TAT-translocated repetitive protein [Georhizobium profundi]AZN72708.1 TIGR03808 family TAT-translocated repetitive protein [Georhizobium profundi]